MVMESDDSAELRSIVNGADVVVSDDAGPRFDETFERSGNPP
jgi:hypothetical protein